MSQRLGRRGFLKLWAAGLAGWALPARAAPATPNLAAALAVAFPHRLIANPETLLTRLPTDADLLLVPAYLVAGLIARRWLQRLAGPAGRAHDPEGAYTVPYRYAVSALVYPAGEAPAAWPPANLAWPAFSRLLLGAALQQRGYSPNDPHAGHVAEAVRDLLALRPALAADPVAAVRAGAARGALAVVPVGSRGTLDVGAGLAVSLPPWGGVVVEYDWVLPASAPDPEAARAWVAALPPAAPQTLPVALRLPPLMPLPERTQAQHLRLWADLTRPRREGAA